MGTTARLTRRGRVALGLGVAALAALAIGIGGRLPGTAPDLDEPVEAQGLALEPSAEPEPSAPVTVAWSAAEAVPIPSQTAVAPDPLVGSSTVAVVIAEDATGDEIRLAAWLARRLVAPVVTRDQLARLEVSGAVAVGAVALDEAGSLDVRHVPPLASAPIAEDDPSSTTATRSETVAATPAPSPSAAPRLAGPPVVDAVAELPGVVNRRTPPVEVDLSAIADLLGDARAARSGSTVLVARPNGVDATDVATALAVGHAVVTVTDDPRVDAAIVRARELRGDGPLATFGRGWDEPAGVSDAALLDVVRAGHELPGGGFRLFPDRRLIALYGHPESAALGLLGEQPPAEAVARTKEYAASYEAVFDEPVVGAFDLITTVAAAGAGERGDYSRRTPIATLRPWVDAARDAGLYVVLDLQSGRADFLSQAREYEELLLEPHVGLALDPEWRLRPNERHLRQIGSVSGHEVNEVIDYLADLTRDNTLPQKLLVVHQFKLSMIRDREVIDTSRPELAVMLHMDGQGSQGSKNGTYAAVVRGAPEGVWFGWKNFLDEDTPGLRSPEDTAAVDPTPWFISYQ